jgi:hypothetical protein
VQSSKAELCVALPSTAEQSAAQTREKWGSTVAVTTNVYKLHLILAGTSPLVVNNIRGADPDEVLVKEIRKITDKKTGMTEEDRQRLEWLKWMVSLYDDPATFNGDLHFPVAAVMKSFARAAGQFRKGTQLTRAVQPAQAMTVIQHDGPKDLDMLYKDAKYRLRNMVNTNPTGKKTMVPTVRPIFPEWAMELDVVLFNDILGEADFTRYAELAGVGEGIGNARPLGYGRFGIRVQKL